MSPNKLAAAVAGAVAAAAAVGVVALQPSPPPPPAPIIVLKHSVRDVHAHALLGCLNPGCVSDVVCDDGERLVLTADELGVHDKDGQHFSLVPIDGGVGLF